jgi:hypothetical protein
MLECAEAAVTYLLLDVAAGTRKIAAVRALSIATSTLATWVPSSRRSTMGLPPS